MSTSPFPLPVLFTAWAWKDGAGIAGEVIRRAKLMGAKTVCVQLSQDTVGNPDDGGSTLDKTDVGFLHDAGLFVVGWDPVGSGTAAQIADLPLDGWMPQVEGPDQRDALFAALKAGVGRGLPKALVTTYGGLDTVADVNALKALWPDVVAFVECYKADGFPHNDIDRMLAQGAVYGFDRSRLLALVGTYRGEMPADYPGLDAADYGGIYLEENTNDDQLRAFAVYATAPTPEEPPMTVDPAACNRQISQIAHTWLDQQTDRKLLSRLRCIDDIATSDDGTWLARRKDVRAAIDGELDVTTADLLKQQLAEAQTALTTAQAETAAVKAELAKVEDERALLAQKIAQAKEALS